MEGDTEKTLSSPPILAPKPAQEEEDTPRRSGRVRKPAVVAVVPPDGPKQTPAGSVLGTKPIHPFFQKKANPVAPVPLPASPTQTAEPPVLSSIPDMFLSADQRKAKRAEQLKQRYAPLPHFNSLTVFWTVSSRQSSGTLSSGRGDRPIRFCSPRSRRRQTTMRTGVRLRRRKGYLLFRTQQRRPGPTRATSTSSEPRPPQTTAR